MDNFQERQNRIEEALNIRGLKQIELAEKSGLPRTSINHWIKQRYQPKQAPLLKMARVLDVSEMWLAGYDVPMERPKEQKKIDEFAQMINVIRKDEKLTNLIINLSKLNKEQLTTIESMVNELVKLNRLH